MTDAWLRRCFLEATRLILLAGAVVSLLVGIWRERDGSDTGTGAVAADARSVVSAFGRMVSIDRDDLGTVESYPFSLVGGTWTLRIGLAVLLVGLVTLVVTAVAGLTRDGAAPRRLPAALAVAAVVLGLALTWAGTAWLPDREIDVGLTPAALLPLLTAVWAGFVIRWTARLDE